MAELRWILLALGLVLFAGIWWWGSRRSAQAPGNAELRETTATAFKEPDFPPEPFVPEPRERSMPGFEPVNIHPAEFDRIPIMHEPIMVDIEPADLKEPLHRFETDTPPVFRPAAPSPPVAEAPVVDRPSASAVDAPAEMTDARVEGRGSPESADRFAPAESPSPNTAEKQKIISIRVCTTGNGRWQGSALLAAFELNGLAYGRYQVFHRRHVDGRSLFCVASMTEPGVFDVTKMQNQEFKGVTLFAVLPGPLEPMLTVDELLLAARDLAIALNGAVQDARGAPMTAQRAAALRDEVARFQASLAAG